MRLKAGESLPIAMSPVPKVTPERRGSPGSADTRGGMHRAQVREQEDFEAQIVVVKQTWMGLDVHIFDVIHEIVHPRRHARAIARTETATFVTGA